MVTVVWGYDDESSDLKELIELKQDIKQKWVAALRSGEYVQGRAKLRSGDDQFCCLGVLCDVLVQDGELPEPVYASGCNDFEYNYSATNLPESTREDLGISPEGQDRLMRMNDHEGASFDIIANYIEANL